MIDPEDYGPSCKRCLKAGCAYCLLDEEDPSNNYCYSYTDLDDPTYGTCTEEGRIEIDEEDRGVSLTEDDYEVYCYGEEDIGFVIVYIIFFYFLIPCICASAIVSLTIKLYRSTCAPSQSVAPESGAVGISGGVVSGGIFSAPGPYTGVRHGRIPYQPQPEQPSPYENLTMADAKIVGAGGGAGGENPGEDVDDGSNVASEIPVVYAEAVPENHRR